MLKPLFKAQRGFTLIELLAVIAILTVLSGLVAGAITGLGASGQAARLTGDRDTIGKAANRFFNEGFPQSYPVFQETSPDLMPNGDLHIRILDFDARLPQDPRKKFVPDFLTDVPSTAGLVSWRIDIRTGKVFFARPGAKLIPPSNAKLAVRASQPVPSTAQKVVASDHTLTLDMTKNQAAIKVLVVDIPAGYNIGGQGLQMGTQLGILTGRLGRDNPWNPGQELAITGTLKATDLPNEWDMQVDYPATVNDFVSTAKIKARGDRVHKVKIDPPSEQTAGQLSLKVDRGTDPEFNEATESWEVTILGTAPVGDQIIITNPLIKGVYVWLAKQHTAIDVENTFNDVPGNQAVVISPELVTALPTPTPTPTPVPGPTPIPTPTPPPTVTLKVVGSLNLGSQFTALANLALNPVTNRVYVDNFASNSSMATMVVDASVKTNPLLVTTLPNAGFGVAVNPSLNKFYTSDGYGGNILVFNGANNQLIKTVDKSGCHAAMEVDTTTGLLYVVSQCGPGDPFEVFSTLMDTKVAGPFSIGGVASGLRVNSGTGRAYVQASNTLRVYGPSPTFSLLLSLPGIGIQAVNPVTNRLYVQAGSDLQVLDGNTHTLLATIPGVGGPAAVDTSTNRVYVVKFGTPDVTIIDGAKNSVVGTVSLGQGVIAMRVVVDSTKQRVYVVGVVPGVPASARLYILEH